MTGGTVWLWNLENVTYQVLGQSATNGTDFERPLATVAFSPDGRTLAAGDANGTIQLWTSAIPPAPALPASRCPEPRPESFPWRWSARTAAPWPAAAATARSSCGTSPSPVTRHPSARR